VCSSDLDRKVGDKIDVLGPLGNGFNFLSTAQNLLLLAGGIGIAPLCELARTAIQKGLRVKLLAGARTSTLIYPTGLIPPGCDYIPVTEDGTAGEKGMVTSYLPRFNGWADQIFCCGPLAMYKTMVNIYLEILKSKPVQVSLEVRMGCGMGFCYACSIKTHQGLKQVCKDGPVFDINDVVWEELR
jgi:dihydroorotate dehydrogenase electron transfer subunit